MGLRRDAERLLETLASVTTGLAAFQGSVVQMEYTEHLRRRLGPLVEELRSLIEERADRSDILRAMAAIKEVMHEVNGAATRGEMNFCEAGVLGTFWKLSTIFQEQRYRDEQR
jgi:hypothetical protein